MLLSPPTKSEVKRPGTYCARFGSGKKVRVFALALVNWDE